MNQLIDVINDPLRGRNGPYESELISILWQRTTDKLEHSRQICGRAHMLRNLNSNTQLRPPNIQFEHGLRTQLFLKSRKCKHTPMHSHVFANVLLDATSAILNFLWHTSKYSEDLLLICWTNGEPNV